MSRTPFTITASAVLSLALAGTLAGCSSAADDAGEQTSEVTASSLDELYDEAVEAGQTSVMIYGPSEAAFEPVYEEFMKAYPEIDVKTEFLFGGDLRTRVDQELTTGQQVGDLIHLDDSVNYVDDLQEMTLVGVEDLPEGASAFDGKVVTPSQSLYTPVYNTEKLAEGDVPQTWAAIAGDASLIGVTGLSDPTSLAATSTVLYTAYEAGAIDDDWLAEVADAKPQIYQSTSQMVGAIATGELSFTPVAYYGFVVTQKALGATIEAAIPTDGVVLSDNPYGLLDGAPSSLAAQLLVSWMLSPEGQAAVAAGANEYGITDDAPAPEGLPSRADLTVFPAAPAEERAQFKQDAVDLMKQFF